MTSPSSAAPSPQQSLSPQRPSLVVRIGAAFTALTLVFALILGLLALTLQQLAGVTAEAAMTIRNVVLLWGLGSVILAAVLGWLFSRQIAAPLRQLTHQLQRSSAEDFTKFSSVYADYAELEQLTTTMRSLAQAIDDREVALLASERRFREGFDLVGIGLTQLDTEGRLVLVNRRFCEMLGYERDELIGRRFVDITHPDDRAADGQLLQGVVTNGTTSISREKRYLRKDGSTLWAQHSGVVVRNDSGAPLYSLGSIEDVSQYHASQETLRALNASLKAIVETSPLAIYSLTPNGLVTLWNPAAEVVFGVAEAEALGRSSPMQSAAGGNREIAVTVRLRVLNGETIRNQTIHWRRDDGTSFTLSLSAAPLRVAGESIVGVLVTCADVTAMEQATRALDEHLHFSQELIEAIPSPVFYKAADGRYLGFNRAWERFFGHRREDWIGKKTAELVDAELAAAVERDDESILAAGQAKPSEWVLADANGEPRTVLKLVSRYTSPDGKPAGIIGVLTDITDVKRVKQELANTEGRFRALTESAMDIVTVLDADGVIRYQSPSIKHLLGYEVSDLLGRSQFDVVHPDDAVRMRTTFATLLDRSIMDQPIEFRVRSKDGSWRYLESVGKNCLDVPEVQGIIVNTRDVTERRAIEQRIEHLAFHDALTGLPNRSLMQDRIAQVIARAERNKGRFAVMFIDIDNFKNINDTLGHDAGDDLLREVAIRLRGSVRAQDTIARQGGDEFIVLLQELDGQPGAGRVAQKVLDALRAPFRLGGAEQHVSGSVGIALFPDDGRDPASLLKNADTAMFHGKALGKNTYQFFTPQMNIAVKRRAVLESNLRAAVKNGDFSLVYQPQVDLETNRVLGFEALVRWISADGGTIMPGEFIPLAEETGLISDLGSWVLFEACRQMRRWQDQGLPATRIAINLSARQMHGKGFIDTLQQALTETRISPDRLEVELTESQVMRQGEGSVALLNQIAEMGVQLAVDDFGTGYSSLSYLKRLPITKLKIDQSFVRDITIDPNDTAIVVAIINMAKSLDLDIIAEGIETAGQLHLLRSKGCNVGQGYYFSAPMEVEEVTCLLRAGTTEAAFIYPA